MGFAGGSQGKESACNVGDLGFLPALGRSPGDGHGNPLQYSCLENPHGQGCLVGYSPWGCKESDSTERLSTHLMTYFLSWPVALKNPVCHEEESEDGAERSSAVPCGCFEDLLCAAPWRAFGLGGWWWLLRGVEVGTRQ